MKPVESKRQLGYSNFLIWLINIIIVLLCIFTIIYLIGLLDGSYRQYHLDSLILTLITVFLPIILLGFVLFQIKSIIKKAIQTELFANKLSKKIRVIGILFISLDVLRLIVKVIFLIMDGRFIWMILEDYLNIGSWSYLIIGIIFVSIAEIIRIGTVIKEENDLTV